MDLYPNNSISDFTVTLKQPIRFDCQYEVALVELTYKHSWSLNVGKLFIELADQDGWDSLDLIYHDGENIKNFALRLNAQVQQYYIEKEYNRRFIMRESGKTEQNLILPDSKYTSTNKNFEVLDQILSSNWYRNLPMFTADPYRFVINFRDKSRVRFDGNIIKILNLENNWYKAIENAQFITAGLIDDPNPNIIESLFIYCDIIDYQFVGDAYAPLLRNVVVDNIFPKTAWMHYDNPHYVDINKSEISTIHVEIRDDIGEKIRFDGGKVIIKLHFRPKKSNINN